MRKFETLLLLSPELTVEEREGTIASLIAVIERENGSMLNTDHWGMKELAYPVQKQMRGYYVRLEYNAPSELIAELERIIRITENVYKFMTVNLDTVERKMAARQKAGAKVPAHNNKQVGGEE